MPDLNFEATTGNFIVLNCGFDPMSCNCRRPQGDQAICDFPPECLNPGAGIIEIRTSPFYIGAVVVLAGNENLQIIHAPLCGAVELSSSGDALTSRVLSKVMSDDREIPKIG